MARTNLKLYSTDGYAKDITTTINYTNPDATKEDILNFTQALNGLTTNTYKQTEKITTINVDSEADKRTPTLTASKTTIIASDFTDQSSGSFKRLNQDVQLTYNGDGDFYIKLPTQQLISIALLKLRNNTPAVQIWYYSSDIPSGTQISFIIGTTETANYKSAEITFNVTT